MNTFTFFKPLGLFVAFILMSNLETFAQSSDHVAARCYGCALVSRGFKENVKTRNNKALTFNYDPEVGDTVLHIISSENRKYSLNMRREGLSIEHNDANAKKVIWTARFSKPIQTHAIISMEGNGNLIVLESMKVIWETGTGSHSESNDGDEKYVILQNHGNLVIYDWDSLSDDDVMWASDSCEGCKGRQN